MFERGETREMDRWDWDKNRPEKLLSVLKKKYKINSFLLSHFEVIMVYRIVERENYGAFFEKL